jgi:hypothetical protein
VTYIRVICPLAMTIEKLVPYQWRICNAISSPIARFCIEWGHEFTSAAVKEVGAVREITLNHPHVLADYIKNVVNELVDAALDGQRRLNK